jgi:hypothetical protein
VRSASLVNAGRVLGGLMMSIKSCIVECGVVEETNIKAASSVCVDASLVVIKVGIV